MKVDYSIIINFIFMLQACINHRMEIIGLIAGHKAVSTIHDFWIKIPF